MNEIVRKEELKKLIIQSLELDLQPKQIEGADLINELGINSIDALELFLNIENYYHIQIPDEDLSADLIKSLDFLASYVSKKLEKEA